MKNCIKDFIHSLTYHAVALLLILLKRIKMEINKIGKTYEKQSIHY